MTTRRDFLQNSAAVVGSIALTSTLAQAKESNVPTSLYPDKLIDDTGCRSDLISTNSGNINLYF